MNTITLNIPENGDTTDVSFGGENYSVQDGKVTVPLAAAEHLYQFGFTNVPPEPAPPPADEKKTGKPSGKKQGNKNAAPAADKLPENDPPAGDDGADDAPPADDKQDGTENAPPADNGQNDGNGEAA